MTDTSLKSCPFCGGKAKFIKPAVELRFIYSQVGCAVCDVFMAQTDVDKLIESWNTRATDAKYEKLTYFLNYISNEAHIKFWDMEWVCNKAKELLKEIGENDE